MRLPVLITALTIVGPCYAFTVTRDSRDPSFSWRGRAPQSSAQPFLAEWAKEAMARLNENRRKEKLLAENLPLKTRIVMCLNRSHPVMPASNISPLSSLTSSSSTSMPDTARRQFIFDIMDEAYSQPREQDQRRGCPIEYKLFGDLALRLWRYEPSDFINFKNLIRPLFTCLETRRPFGLELFQLMRSIERGDVTSVNDCYPDRSADRFLFASTAGLPEFSSSTRRWSPPRIPRIQLDVTIAKTPADNIQASTRRIGIKSAPIGRNVERELLEEPAGDLGMGETLQDYAPLDQGRRRRPRARTSSSSGIQSEALKNIMKLLINKKGKLVRFKQMLRAHKANNKSNKGTTLVESRFKKLLTKLSNSARLNKDKGRGGLVLPRKEKERGEKGRITRRERDFLLELIAAMKDNSDGSLVCDKECRRLIAKRLRLAPRVRDEHD